MVVAVPQGSSTQDGRHSQYDGEAQATSASQLDDKTSELQSFMSTGGRWRRSKPITTCRTELRTNANAPGPVARPAPAPAHDAFFNQWNTVMRSVLAGCSPRDASASSSSPPASTRSALLDLAMADQEDVCANPCSRIPLAQTSAGVADNAVSNLVSNPGCDSIASLMPCHRDVAQSVTPRDEGDIGQRDEAPQFDRESSVASASPMSDNSLDSSRREAARSPFGKRCSIDSPTQLEEAGLLGESLLNPAEAFELAPSSLTEPVASLPSPLRPRDFPTVEAPLAPVQEVVVAPSVDIVDRTVEEVDEGVDKLASDIGISSVVVDEDANVCGSLDVASPNLDVEGAYEKHGDDGAEAFADHCDRAEAAADRMIDESTLGQALAEHPAKTFTDGGHEISLEEPERMIDVAACNIEKPSTLPTVQETFEITAASVKEKEGGTIVRSSFPSCQERNSSAHSGSNSKVRPISAPMFGLTRSAICHASLVDALRAKSAGLLLGTRPGRGADQEFPTSNEFGAKVDCKNRQQESGSSTLPDLSEVPYEGENAISASEPQGEFMARSRSSSSRGQHAGARANGVASSCDAGGSEPGETRPCDDPPEEEIEPQVAANSNDAASDRSLPDGSSEGSPPSTPEHGAIKEARPLAPISDLHRLAEYRFHVAQKGVLRYIFGRWRACISTCAKSPQAAEVSYLTSTGQPRHHIGSPKEVSPARPQSLQKQDDCPSEETWLSAQSGKQFDGAKWSPKHSDITCNIDEEPELRPRDAPRQSGNFANNLLRHLGAAGRYGGAEAIEASLWADGMDLVRSKRGGTKRPELSAEAIAARCAQRRERLANHRAKKASQQCLAVHVAIAAPQNSASKAALHDVYSAAPATMKLANAALKAQRSGHAPVGTSSSRPTAPTMDAQEDSKVGTKASTVLPPLPETDGDRIMSSSVSEPKLVGKQSIDKNSSSAQSASCVYARAKRPRKSVSLPTIATRQRAAAAPSRIRRQGG